MKDPPRGLTRRRRRMLQAWVFRFSVLERAPGALAVVAGGQVGHHTAGSVHVPAPEERTLEVGAVRLEHAEDQAVHAVQNPQLEDVGAQEAPDRPAEDLREAGLAALFPVLGRAPEAVLLDAPGVLVER